MREFLITCKYMRVLIEKHKYWRRVGRNYAGFYNERFPPNKQQKREIVKVLMYSELNPFR